MFTCLRLLSQTHAHRIAFLLTLLLCHYNSVGATLVEESYRPAESDVRVSEISLNSWGIARREISSNAKEIFQTHGP